MVRITFILLLWGLTVVMASNWNVELHKGVEMNVEEYQRMVKIRHLSEEFFSFYRNITLSDVVPETRLPTQQDLQCYAEFAQLTAGLVSGSLWAYRMIDSWGSVPAGILVGHFKDLGNYDECINIQQAVTSNYNVNGKYCLAQLPLQQLLGIAGPMEMLKIQTAVCFPASCSAANMDTLLLRLLNQLIGVDLNAELSFVKESTCKTADRESYDGLTIFTIVLLSVFGTAVGLATLYDYFLCEDQEKLPAILRIFSARYHSRGLFRVSNNSNPNVVHCLHGLRGMSLIWVCFGHNYLVSISMPNINLLDVYKWAKSPFMMVINEGVFAVDTFFFISGMLVSMVALRSIEKAKGKLNIPLMYLHRYLRLTPVVAVSILVYLKVLPLLGDGPLFGKWNFDNYDSCNENWYWTLLYVQNYAADRICLAQTWYLAIDMQLYIIAPLLLIIVFKWGTKGAAFVLLLTLLLAAYLFSIMVIKDLSIISGGDMGLSQKTHNRTSGWLVGFLFGYYLHTIRGKSIKLSRPSVWIGWLICLALLFTCIFAMYPYGPAKSKSISILSEAFYVSLSRIAWPLGLSWVVFACMQGYGGLANSFLSSPLWQPLSKLSYCIYMYHLLIQNLNAGRTRVNTYFSDYDLMLRFWQDFGFSLILAYIMYILIEAPFGGLESLILPNRRAPPTPKLPLAETEPKVNLSDNDAEKQTPAPEVIPTEERSESASAPPLEREYKTELEANDGKVVDATS
ncbi:nose resistant to fluoxetine protein 6 [Drosophila guanche]|uniref:Blast:Nose resistant to fluoxetine protein 6 n=1 Tax=Drosophila guanche TaxID=7266 RepID=A0A3B0K6C6_DROGU|nr:nose resistant to fluoxetine protein 6 [Drosophila guanche]SPP88232.1 blast:Nose resistant to fluoxetine protein 6 [Drosophila guanche]